MITKTRRKGRKVLAAVLTFLLALCMIPGAAMAAPPGTAEINIELIGSAPAEGYVSGDEFTVSVVLSDNPGITSAGIALFFDTDVLEYVPGSLSVASPSILASGWIPILNDTVTEDGYVSVVAMYFMGMSMYIDSLQNGILYTVKFKVKDDAPSGTHVLTALRTGSDHPDNFSNAVPAPVPVNFNPYSFTVKGTTVTPTEPAKVAVGSVATAVAPGDSFTVPVTITDNPGFFGAGFTLGFDSAALELVSFDASGTLLDGSLLDYLPSASAGYAGATEVTGDGTLFNVTFKVKVGASVGTYPITVGLKDGSALNFVDDWANPLDIAFTAGSVKVKAPVIPHTDTTIVVGSATDVEPGGTITLPVTVDANAGFATAFLKVDYDTTVMTLISVVPSADLPSGFSIIANPVIGAVSILGGGMGENITADIKLFDLVFEVKSDAVTGDNSVSVGLLTPNVFNFGDAASNPVPVFFESGTVSVVVVPEIVIPGDLDMPAFDEGSSWIRTYDGTPQSVSIDLLVGGGTGVVTVYYNGSTTAPTNVGNYTVSITVAGIVGYKPITTPVTVGTLKIIKAPAPTITWPTASSITYGQIVNESVLSGGSTEYGSFAWHSSIAGGNPPAGTYYYPVVFTPSADTLLNYETIAVLTQDVELIVNKAAAPVITDWPTASSIRRGQSLASSMLSFTSNSYGTFAWTDSTITPAYPGGVYEVTFTPYAFTSDNFEPIVITTYNVAVKVIIPGDLDNDGEVTAVDAMRILQHASGFITLVGDELIAADVDGDGFVTAADAVLAVRITIGLA